MSDIVLSSATEMARAVRKKELSSTELVQAHLDRIDAVNPMLNAVVTRCDDQALAAAADADRAVADGDRLGLFHGVPITVKDALDTAGIRTTGGSTGLRENVPDTNATTVQRLIDAGAIVVGKTNTPDLTLSYETDNLVFGRTNNPYDLERSPGGSSGGAAAAIAAGLSALDLGTDTGGSIRYPSHVCGTAGIRPTSGRVPRTGLCIPFGTPVDAATVVGPMARTVEDLAVALGVVSGPDGVDPAIVPMPGGDAFNTPLRRLRVAMYVDDGVVPADPEVADAVRAAAEVLAEAGAQVTEARPAATVRAGDLFNGVFGGDAGQWFRRILERFGSAEHGFGPPPEHQPPAAAYVESVENMASFQSEMLRWFQDYDLILCPPHAHAALAHGASMAEGMGGAGYLMTFNLTGWPGAVVRAGTTPVGLPIGVQLVAHPWQDHVALAAALEVEEALGGWKAPTLP
ncbi:MAG: amidase [Actinomycetota bacterium]